MAALSEKTIETVKATIPFLSENGERLTTHFYERMFREDPEVKEYFNAAHQVSGGQQGALAASVCAFARNIETPENLADAVSLIGSKHVSLGVKPEHYPIVGKHLLASIDELLDPAPSEVLEAWGEAYGFLAGVLIGAEESLYESQDWNGFKDFEVVKREQESVNVTSFYLKAKDGGGLPDFSPGQYITVRVATADGSTTMRNYSLSHFGCEDCLRISVKREDAYHADEPDGYVSHFLHEKVDVGDVLEVGPPCGDFLLDVEKLRESGRPLVLLSGGIGVTPLLAMLHACAGTDVAVSFVHGAIDSAHHAMRDEVLGLAGEHANVRSHFRYSAPKDGDVPDSSGLFDREFLSDFIEADSEVYFCGPKAMMSHVLGVLEESGHDDSLVHYEFFGPAEDLKKCPFHH